MTTDLGQTENLSISRRQLLLLLVCGALVVRLLAMVAFEGYQIKGDWEFGYETGQIAESLALGQGFSGPFLETSEPTAWLMPGYPLLVAAVFKLLGVFSPLSALVVLLLDIFFSALTLVPLYLLAQRYFNQAVALICATVFVFYPPSIWHAINTVWDTTLFTFLIVWLLYLLSSYSGNFVWQESIKLGSIMGGIALVNAVILIFYPFVVFWLLAQNRAAMRKKLFFCVLLTITVCCSLSPWVVRNYVQFDRFMLRSNFGVELWLGNNQSIFEKLMHTKSESFIDLHPTINKNEFEKFKDLGELAYADEKYSAAADFITENLDKVLFLSKKKFVKYWLGSLGGEDGWVGRLTMSFSVSTLKMLCHVLPFPFFLLGLAAIIKQRRHFLLLALLSSLPLVYYITHVSERYRFPIDPVVLLLASYGFYLSFVFIRNLIRGELNGCQHQ